MLRGGTGRRKAGNVFYTRIKLLLLFSKESWMASKYVLQLFRITGGFFQIKLLRMHNLKVVRFRTWGFPEMSGGKKIDIILAL